MFTIIMTFVIMVSEVSAMTIGKSILKFRTDKGLTQKEFSDMCGFSQSALNLWENEKRNPKIEQLRKIATVFQCNILDVVEYDTGITDETDPETVELLKLNAEVTQILKKYGSCKTLSKEDEQKLIEYNSRVQKEYEQKQREEADKKAPKFTDKVETPAKKSKLFTRSKKEKVIEDGNPPKFTTPSTTYAPQEAYELLHSLIDKEGIDDRKREEVSQQLKKILISFKGLNEIGRKKAVERIEELYMIPKYIFDNFPDNID